MRSFSFLWIWVRTNAHTHTYGRAAIENAYTKTNIDNQNVFVCMHVFAFHFGDENGYICIYRQRVNDSELDHPTEEIQHHAPKIYINDIIMKVIIILSWQIS